MTLAALEQEVARDLDRLQFGGPGWTVPRHHAQGPVYDVVIVGGGQGGLGAAFGLLRERVPNILVIDENEAGYEGPWDSYARMATLRTPKGLTGIDLGIPSLTFRAFWEAQHGPDGWERLGRIARLDWMAYLRWYRRVLRLPVRNGARLTLVEPLADGLFQLHLEAGAPLTARRVVLATGIQGGGAWWVPDFVRAALPPHLYAHTSQPIEAERIAGRRIAILGGGASAFDNAHHALAAGAAEVHVFMRRAELPRVNPIRFMEQIALPPRYPALEDADKYAVMAAFFRHNQPPTNDMFDAACAYPDFHLHLGAPWQSVALEDGRAMVQTPTGRHGFDFLILSTGLLTDPALRPELALLADGIARWGDRYAAPAAIANPVIDAHPYLGPGFEFLPREGADPALSRIHAFNYSALISLGLSASALSGLGHALPRLVRGVADGLFLVDKDALLADFFAYAEPEFLGQWPRPAAQRKAG